MYNKEMIKPKQKYFKIFNIDQSKFFYKEGAKLQDFGKEGGYVYHLFIRDEVSEVIFTRWCDRNK